MRIDFKSRASMALFAGGAVLMSSCALTNRPQPLKQFFLPPTREMAAPSEPLLEPPAPPSAFYGNELPAIDAPLAPMARPTDAEFLIKKADDSFADGKKAIEAGRAADARLNFDHAVDALLSAPENLPDRPRVERRLEELIEAIYRYDADQAIVGDPDKVVYDKSPKDDMIELTFTPADPGTRSKVLDLIHSTASQLPLQQHDTVIGAVNYFTSDRGKKIIAAGLRRQARYKPMIERVLGEEGVPLELLFLAQAESGYLPRAQSNKLCVGLWQFGRATGHDYGLMQTASTDDRMDPEKATRAAARYLKDLYTHFGDWYLAMAAYDCGPACVDHAVMRTGYADFFELRRLNALPKETQNYVPVILAMTIVGKNAAAYGLDHLDLEAPPRNGFARSADADASGADRRCGRPAPERVERAESGAVEIGRTGGVQGECAEGNIAPSGDRICSGSGGETRRVEAASREPGRFVRGSGEALLRTDGVGEPGESRGTAGAWLAGSDSCRVSG